MLQRLRLPLLCVLLALYAAFMISTNHRLTMLDDESTIIVTAHAPTLQRLALFVHGDGQHLHPPLTDILLHEWLQLTNYSFAWLRVSAILLYIAGLVMLAKAGEILGNTRTFWAVLLAGVLWPFGYFYARITGWYCFSFLLMACATYVYLKLLHRSTPLRWTGFATIAILLVWSNYFGLFILTILLADLLLFSRRYARQHAIAIMVTLAAILVSFLPLIHSLTTSTGNAQAVPSLPWITDLLQLGYMLFALLASVAVAPWFFLWSVPALLAAACVYLFLLIQPASRKYALYFLLLILALQGTHTLDLKRLLFVSPWLILAIALSCTTGLRHWKQASVSALAFVFSIGWIGIISGKHPATTNFYEPWQSVATRAFKEAQQGDAIVSDSGVFFFYLDQLAGLDRVSSNNVYLGRSAYESRGLHVFEDGFPAGTAPTQFSRVIAVRSMAMAYSWETMNHTVETLKQSCRLLHSERMVPDPAAEYRRVLVPYMPAQPTRVAVDTFECSPPR